MSKLVETKEYQDLWHKMTKEINKLKENPNLYDKDYEKIGQMIYLRKEILLNITDLENNKDAMLLMKNLLEKENTIEYLYKNYQRPSDYDNLCTLTDNMIDKIKVFNKDNMNNLLKTIKQEFECISQKFRMKRTDDIKECKEYAIDVIIFDNLYRYLGEIENYQYDIDNIEDINKWVDEMLRKDNSLKFMLRTIKDNFSVIDSEYTETTIQEYFNKELGQMGEQI